MARTSNIALRLLASLKGEAERVTKEEGTSLNQFINIAVAEKIAALRTARYFQERAARADVAAFERILAHSGNEPPRLGDEIPPDYDPEAVRRRSRQRKFRSE
jgi:hypothetical protein